jgi:tRNA(Arg) A34 adenosine deaminase TadA
MASADQHKPVQTDQNSYEELVSEALDAMREGFNRDVGLRPFGAVVARAGKVIAKASNTCERDRDPTAHAEINAIRMAARTLGSLDLSDCVLVASAQPCPMCRAAAFHSGIRSIVYASCWSDYRDLFPDHACFEEMSAQPDRRAQLSTRHHAEAIRLWDDYRQHRVNQSTAPVTP